MQHLKFLAKARKLKAEQTGSEVQFLDLLVAQEEDRIAWRPPTTSYRSWHDLLRGEGLCTVTTYVNYKKATTLISADWIMKLGVYASISIAKLDPGIRADILGTVKDWYNFHKVPPAYQRVSKYVRDMGLSKRRRATASKTQKMGAYIRKCQALLKTHLIPIPIPKETWK